MFENFRNMCLETCELDPGKFLSAGGLKSQAALKKTKVKLDLLFDIDMFLIVQKGLRGGICHSIYRYAKGNNKYVKNYDKIKNCHIFHMFNIGMNWDVMKTSQKTVIKKVMKDIF